MFDMTHSYVWHEWFTCVTWLIEMCDMNHSYVLHDTLTCRAWLLHICNTHAYTWHACVRHDSFIRVTWLILMRALTHLYCRIRLIHMRDMALWYAWNPSFSVVTVCHVKLVTLYKERDADRIWLITQSYGWHNSLVCMTWVILTCCVIQWTCFGVPGEVGDAGAKRGAERICIPPLPLQFQDQKSFVNRALFL